MVAACLLRSHNDSFICYHLLISPRSLSHLKTFRVWAVPIGYAVMQSSILITIYVASCSVLGTEELATEQLTTLIVFSSVPVLTD